MFSALFELRHTHRHRQYQQLSVIKRGVIVGMRLTGVLLCEILRELIVSRSSSTMLQMLRNLNSEKLANRRIVFK